MRQSDERTQTSGESHGPDVHEAFQREAREADRFQWDWVTFMVALVVAVILAAFTCELWLPHDTVPH